MAHQTPQQAAKQAQTLTERLLTQIRNAVVFIAIVIAIGLIGSVITGIAIAAHHHSSSSSCLSQGGTDPSC